MRGIARFADFPACSCYGDFLDAADREESVNSRRRQHRLQVPFVSPGRGWASFPQGDI
jgi:hypothetical protein